MENKLQNIKCPHCGAEYHPTEIIYPNTLYGRPSSIIKDALGRIIYVEYEEHSEPDNKETFICEYCNKQFVVEVNQTFKSEKEEEALDFTNQFTSLL